MDHAEITGTRAGFHVAKISRRSLRVQRRHSARAFPMPNASHHSNSRARSFIIITALPAWQEFLIAVLTHTTVLPSLTASVMCMGVATATALVISLPRAHG